VQQPNDQPEHLASSADPHPTVGKIGDLAAESGIRRIHILAWRDLADVEAGGSELHAATVASLWADAGIEVMMRASYAQGSPPETTRDGYIVVRRAGRYLVFPRAVVSELLGRHGRRDALVEIWNGVPFFSPIWARGPRVTWLHHVHEEMWPMVLPPKLAKAGQLLERWFAPPFYQRTPIITLSRSSQRDIINRLRLRGENITVVPPGIGAGFTPGGRRADRPLVLGVGRLMPSKAFDILIEAVAEARRSVPSTHLVIVGEGYERDILRRRIGELGAEEWCELAGRVDDDTLLHLYRSAWVVASASRSEGWGMTLTEAAACGTPAVASRISGHVDAVEDGVTGLLTDTDRELPGALSRILSNRDLRDRLGHQAEARAARLSWERTAHDTLAVLAAQCQPPR